MAVQSEIQCRADQYFESSTLQSIWETWKCWNTQSIFTCRPGSVCFSVNYSVCSHDIISPLLICKPLQHHSMRLALVKACKLMRNQGMCSVNGEGLRRRVSNAQKKPSLISSLPWMNLDWRIVRYLCWNTRQKCWGGTSQHFFSSFVVHQFTAIRVRRTITSLMVDRGTGSSDNHRISQNHWLLAMKRDKTRWEETPLTFLSFHKDDLTL